MIRVLVCDDQALVRTGFVTMLDNEDDLSVVGEAADGRTAVEAARRLRPDVVVMDIRMPGYDGIEATRELAGPSASRPVKVLIVTTFHLDEYVYEALRAGASGFLLKDAQPHELTNAVRTVAHGDALLAPSVTRRLLERHAARLRPVEGEPGGRPAALHALSDRELEVLALLSRGWSNAEIAHALVLSAKTVKSHVSRILSKLGLRDRVQAVVLAFELGLVASSPDDDRDTARTPGRRTGTGTPSTGVPVP